MINAGPLTGDNRSSLVEARCPCHFNPRTSMKNLGGGEPDLERNSRLTDEIIPRQGPSLNDGRCRKLTELGEVLNSWSNSSWPVWGISVPNGLFVAGTLFEHFERFEPSDVHSPLSAFAAAVSDWLGK